MPGGWAVETWEPAPQEFAKAKIRYRRAPGRSIEANIGEYAEIERLRFATRRVTGEKPRLLAKPSKAD